MRPGTPESISPRVKAFLRQCGIAASPRYLPFTPLSPEYQRGYCHNNCEAEVAVRGGKVICGWMVWEHHVQPLIEAEFHAVVKRDGGLLDITPRQRDDKALATIAALVGAIVLARAVNDPALSDDILRATKKRLGG